MNFFAVSRLVMTAENMPSADVYALDALSNRVEVVRAATARAEQMKAGGER
jgi:DNA-directed RNA polymerase subunit K/omega